MNSNGRSGFVDGEFMGRCPVGDYWLRYDNGLVVFDFPELIPEYVKQAIYLASNKVFQPALDGETIFNHPPNSR